MGILAEKYNDILKRKVQKITIDDVNTKYTEVANKLEALQILFTEKIAKSETSNNIINIMHSELQKYKNEMYFNIIKPILMDIIELREGMIQASNADDPIETPEEATPDILKVYIDYSKDIIERYGVTLYKSNIGDDIIPLKHKIIDVIETKDIDQDKKIAKSFNYGYEYNGKSIAPEKVIAFTINKDI